MRIEVIVGLFSIMVSVGMVVVIMGQHKELAIAEEQSERAKEDFQQAFDRLSSKELFKESVVNLLQQGKKAVEELEPLVQILAAEKQKKEKDDVTCQTEKQTTRDELAQKEKELTDAAAPLKVESDAWMGEIAKLQEQLQAYSPICDFLRADVGDMKLCENPAVAAA